MDANEVLLHMNSTRCSEEDVLNNEAAVTSTYGAKVLPTHRALIPVP